MVYMLRRWRADVTLGYLPSHAERSCAPVAVAVRVRSSYHATAYALTGLL